jgi:hypothetical protein
MGFLPIRACIFTSHLLRLVSASFQHRFVRLYTRYHTALHLDVGLLLGERISGLQLNVDALGRVLDRIYDVGTSTVLSYVALRAVKLFNLDTTHVHDDTISRTVYGDYDCMGKSPTISRL